jgi:hypothetical protein
LSEHHQHVGYEKTDAETGPLALLAVAIGLLMLVALTGVAVMWRVMAFDTKSTYSSGELVGSPLAPQRPLPPQPRLQVTNTADLKEARDAENERLATSGWIDQEKGVLFIPIDRAMDIIATRGVPPGNPDSPAWKGQDAAKKAAAK